MAAVNPPEHPRPVDRARQVLAGVLAEARERLPHDGEDPSVPVAGTVVLLRDGERGPEVLLLERPDRGSFAGAWVFPGGKREDADAAEDGSEEGAARRAAVRETFEEAGLVVDLDSLWALSCWDPPPGLPLRIRTWFFVARAGDGSLALSADEAVDARWLRPEDVLERHAGGEVTLYPPTWVTLHTLAGKRDVDALVAMLRRKGFRRYETIARQGPAGPLLLWQEDAEYRLDGGESDRAADPARHRLEIGELPWIYTAPDPASG
ncbi:NUDIX hydrolase [Microbacterium sp. ET2]|uniref:NUDIX hydrolase n=1 Tax=Microbacterium albipurpureum TaxID=3050384 RepID=UPI00259C80DA|nr:NUDIX hydrolase [Microbacterium sp. ET2 (Ac-2212)]WJL95161.1 NUDIX hydrolase [Microbacterium sp. ET2 (Ac-2212)]